MRHSLNKIFIGTIFFVLTNIFAVVGYTLFGWTLLEALYMVVITIFGVGYGEVKPLETPSEKIFTISVIIAGTSSAVYLVGGFVQMVAEGEINRTLDTHRKEKEIQSLEQQTIICGFGRIGQILAEKLQEDRQTFVVIDRDHELLLSAEQMGYLTQEGKGVFLVLALRRQDGTLIKKPQPGTILAVGDKVIVMGHKGDIPNFAIANKL
jgi:voltage-gated potassium channel